MRLYKCEACGNIVEMVQDSGVNPVCCGKEMTELIPGTSDGAVEKHVPVVKIKDCKVCVMVGEEPHPMEQSHYIEWIAIETTTGLQKKHLKPGDKPEAKFMLTDCEKLVTAYAYCNMHGFWKCK